MLLLVPVPVPVSQVPPLLVLYCQVVVPPSSPLTSMRLLLVTPSPGLPVSFDSAKVGADGAAVSMVMTAVLLVSAVLPARSVWRTRTWPML